MPELLDSLSRFHTALTDFCSVLSSYQREAARIGDCLDRLEGRPSFDPQAFPTARPPEGLQSGQESEGIKIHCPPGSLDEPGDNKLLHRGGEGCEWFHSILEASPSYVHIWCRSSSGGLVFANPAAAQAMGYAARPTNGQGAEESRADRAGNLETADQDVLRTGQAAFGRVETRLTASGPRWIRVNRYPVQDERGHVAGVTAFGLDITELRQAEQSLAFSENRARTLFEHANDAMWLYDQEGRFKEVNSRACELLGHTHRSLLSMTIGQVLAPEYASSMPAWWAILREKGEAFFEAAHLNKDGRRLEAEVSLRLIESEEGPLALGITRDITERKQSEEALREAHRFNDQIIRCAQEGIIVYGPDLRYQAWNPFMEQLSGLPASEVLGRHPLELFPFLQEVGVIERLERALAGEVLEAFDYPYENPLTGQSGWVSDGQAPLRNAKGEIVGVIGTVSEITARKRAEEQTRRFNEELERLIQARTAELLTLSQAVEQSPSSVVVTDPQGHIQYVNPRFTEMTGHTLQEAQGKIARILRPDCASVDDPQDVWRNIGSGRVWRGEVLSRRKNGQSFWEKVAIAPVRDEQGAITHLVANTEDITGQRLLEAARLRLSMALEQTADATAILELDGTVTYANPAFHQVLGLTNHPVLGEPLSAILADPEHPDRLPEILAQALEGRSWKGRQTAFKHGSGKLILDLTLSPVRDATGNISAIVVVFRDSTKEIERGRQLIQAQKMDSLGALAGGVAHDFNNLLSAILTATELIEWHLEPDSPIRSKLAIIYQVSQQARELNRQILSFSRRSEEKRIPFDLSLVVREAARLLKTTLPQHLSLRREVASSIWIAGDPSQMHQVVMNLVINGCQAIGEKDGNLLLGLGEREIGESDGLPLAPGRYAELVVQDTGSGMDAQTLEKIFEPFFTTRAAGEGTGLGLSVVHGIVHSHGGHIKVESAVGKGSTFWVYLPCTVMDTTAPLPDAGRDYHGSERILLVDDEDIVTALAKQGLEELGFNVIAKTSPGDALEVFQSQPGAFDLLITDMALPGFSGAELARRIRRIRPGLPAILITGTIQAASAMPSLTVTFDETLAKPLTAKDLGAAIRRVMDARKLQDPQENYPEADSPYDQGGLPLVLLADDSHVTRMLLRTWLAKAGYRVQEAQDGQEAWEHFVAAQNRSPFSVVLTDIIMPRMDGLELVEKIRKTDPDVPVLILSSVEDAETAKKALHLHVNEFLMKPFDSQALVAALERLLTEGLSRTQKEHLQETTQAVRMAHKVMEAVPEQELPIFSICEPLKEAGGDVFRTIRRPDGTILFLLADVAGHSVMSSYAVASFLGMLSTFLQEDPHVASLFQRLNRSIQEGPFPDIPIATLAASWSPRMGRFHVINAGIPYGLWQRKSLNRTEAIALDGAPLGLLDQPRTNEKVLVLEPGDRLFFATDGLFDVASKTKQPFRELAAAQWQGLVDAPVAQALGNLCEAARIHGNGVIGDDLLAIALEQPTWTSLENEFNRSIPSSPDAIEQVCAEFETFLKQQPATLDLDKSRRFEIQLAFREALSNAHRHGNKGELRERIAIHACLKAHSLDIRVVDAGRGFKLEPARTQPDAIREGGRGIPILQSTTKLLRMHAGELELQMDLNGEADGREN